ncbi:hypothetical protein NEUTE1DRAFT_101244 [Neurospora tetrasperma FGSC 2508]|uniref:Uncharacterized protein n=1 Tax=Neurospora tetrasperma (strain FGSC 2508 / ATCC MYA-4615 / P0657) TaxID=510951 RepID=F8MLC4_NEUT8|nr:uncharacterized protein NEUTE1DRAFT_101244 [Neurospora tetrasperma FGSC 2508]EGO58397.1 hypothetical protein NEUTE1DRAFT_101244 [Neurospora tetrasperma FGSC 2508]EGZ71273.1 hypothetical protein NEUTE2DRAFT_66711 [Neurospora tetrasperma FGSC 2509]
MSNPTPSQPSQTGSRGRGQGGQGPSNITDYPRQPGWREPHCPRCAYRAANVGKALRKLIPTADKVQAFELVGELSCAVSVGEEESGIMCNYCRNDKRAVEFHYPPGRGFEETSGRLWKSFLDLAGHCYNLDAQPNSWEIGLGEVEEASRQFLACWHELYRQYGKDLLQMSAHELTDVGCTSVVTVPGVEKPVAARPTSAGPRAVLESVLDQVQKMGKDFNNFATEFHKHAENTKTEIELLNDTTAQLEADFAQLQIQDKDLATSFEDHSVRLISEVKDLAQYVKAQGRTLTAVKIMVDRLAINFNKVANAALTPDTTGEQRQ